MSIFFLHSATMYPKFLNWKVENLAILVETNGGLVLVDTGLGVHDHVTPSKKVKFFRFQMGIPYAPEEPLVRQLPQMGFNINDVKHIVMTHLHFDHAGGLADFPWVQVHLHKKELDAKNKPGTWLERFAYDQADFAHHPDWVIYEHCTEKWYEFDAIPLPFEPKMYLIPLFGHTSGHCGVAIQDGSGWIFQAADSIPTNAEFDLTPGWLNRMVIGSHVDRIKAFAQSHPEVRVLAGHTYQVKKKKNS